MERIREEFGRLDILVNTAATVLLMGLVPALGWLYFLPVLLASAYLLRHNVALVLQPSSARARTMFLASNVYLMGVLLAILLATLVPSPL